MIIVVLLTMLGILKHKYDQVEEDRDVYRKNMDSYMMSYQTYKTKDSLNVISLSSTMLSLAEYKKYRGNDLKTIESLRVDKKRLQSIIDMGVETEIDIKGYLKDSMILVDTVYIPMKCLDIKQKWFDLSGCIIKDEFIGKCISRDSFKIIEHIIPKKFLFIKYGVKERRTDIVPSNPDTEIIGVDWITIRY